MGTIMDCCRIPRKIPRTAFGNSIATAVIAAALACLPGAIAPTVAADDQNCLACHGSAGMEKKLQDGGTLQLHVAPDLFAKSVHGAFGCSGCHSDIDPAAHPPANKEIASARGFSITMMQICRGCHADKFDQWQSSIHAALVRSSNPAAPICTDCHDPHAVVKGAAESVGQIPCQKCHTDIYQAYLGSMHGQARTKNPDSGAPICSDCHSAHAVKPTSLGQGPETACFGCHAGVQESHETWLPNTALHFEVVSCPACHAPTAQRKVDLMLFDAKEQPLGTERAEIGVPVFEASSQSGSKGIDAQTLWNLLQTLNRSGIAGKTVLRGRLEAATGPQAHQLAVKSQAISDCRTCHSAGATAFQSVTISLVEPQGQRVGFGVNPDVLSSPVSLESVGGFYAIGATRIKILDILVILAVLGGVGVAVGHLTLGWIFRYFGFYHPAIGGHRPAQGAAPGDGQGAKSA